MREDQAGERPSAQHADRDMLRAMAHPMRLEIMERIGRRGTARAADIAADLDAAANSVSYHLRILARAGIVVEAPEHARDRRDRVWKLAREDFCAAPWNDPSSTEDDYIQAYGVSSLAMFEWMREAWQAELARHSSSVAADGPPGDGSIFASSLLLTRDQAREAVAELQETLQRYARMNRDEDGADLPADPAGAPLTSFRVLFALAGDPAVAEHREHP